MYPVAARARSVPSPASCLEDGTENISLQVRSEEPDAPQADDAGERQKHAEDRARPPARIAEQLLERPELLADAGLRIGPACDPGRRLFQVGSE